MIVDKFGSEYNLLGIDKVVDKYGNVYYQTFSNEYKNVALGVVPEVSSVYVTSGTTYDAVNITDGLIGDNNKRWISTVEDEENYVVFKFLKKIKFNKMIFHTGAGTSYAIPGAEIYVKNKKIAEYHNNPTSNIKKEVLFNEVTTDNIEIRFFQDDSTQLQFRVFEIEIWGYKQEKSPIYNDEYENIALKSDVSATSHLSNYLIENIKDGVLNDDEKRYVTGDNDNSPKVVMSFNKAKISKIKIYSGYRVSASIQDVVASMSIYYKNIYTGELVELENYAGNTQYLKELNFEEVETDQLVFELAKGIRTRLYEIEVYGYERR